MTIDRAARTPVALDQLPDMVETIDQDGLVLELEHGFRTETGAPGYLFRLSDQGRRIGEVAVVVTNDLDLVRNCGHIGCDFAPEHRNQGYVTRVGNALVPLLKARGINPLLITCDAAHKALFERIQSVGGERLDELPADGSQSAKMRFLIR
jgi:predicted acetyltransferase